MYLARGIAVVVGALLGLGYVLAILRILGFI
jgi:hypothetical protein